MQNLRQIVTGTREIARLVRGQPTSDGDGVKLTRVIGGRSLADLDPFLMLDEFGSESSADYIGGFPSHPHRGFETVTYMLEGRMRHRDNQGNEGLLVPGSVQWMTAGRGIIHSEMPEQEEGRMRGFQLWVNLPAKDKAASPGYQAITSADIPVVCLPGEAGKARIIAGKFEGTKGPARTFTPINMWDLRLSAGASLDLDLIDTAQDLVDRKRKAEDEQQKVAHMKRLLARKRELLTEIAMIQRDRTEAEKETRAAERQLEFGRRRAERLGQRTNGPRDGRPVRIDVDGGAWAVLHRDAVAQGTYLIWRMGELVQAEVQQLAADDVTGMPASRRRRGPGEADPSPRRRFLRIDVDDETWRAFRLVTVDNSRTSARYLGEIAEAEAHRLGWRARRG